MIYDNCPTFVAHSIEQVQRRAALACTGAYRDTIHAILLKELGWLSLSKRREYYKFCRMYKVLSNISPAYLVSRLPLNRVDTVHALRNNNDIRVLLSRILSYRKLFLPSTNRAWNALDLNIQLSRSLFTFKILMRSLFFPKQKPLFHMVMVELKSTTCILEWGLAP